MSIPHLNDDELNLAVIGEELPPEATEHMAGCLVCGRRRDAFLALVERPGGWTPTRRRGRGFVSGLWRLGEPEPASLGAVAGGSRSGDRAEPAAAAARPRPAPPAINTEAVMVEVDQMLDRDPLSAMAAEEVVDTVVPVSPESGERSVS